MPYCCVPFCTSDSRQGEVNFHEFPSNSVLCQKWLVAISRKGESKGSWWIPSQRSTVCGKHFSEDDYKPNLSRKLLKPGVVPSVFPQYPKYKRDSSIKLPQDCVAYGCTNNSRKKEKNKEEQITFHRFPKNIKQRNLWVQQVRRKDWKPSKTSVLCSKHFKESSMDRTSLQVVRVHEGAVPENFQSHSPQKVAKSKQPFKREALKQRKKSEINTTNQCLQLKNTEIPSRGNSEKLNMVSIKSCCIENCKSYHKTGTDIVFHKFPLDDEELTRKWIKNICQPNLVPTVDHVICSEHFNADCYISEYACANQLKSDAIPTVFDFPIKKQKLLKELNTFSTAMTDTAEDITYNLNKMNELPNVKDESDSGTNTDIEELFPLENGSEYSQEDLKQKLKKLTSCYKKSQTKMKGYRQRCKLYAKEVTELKEIINNLKEIISVTDGNYFIGAS